jgi:serine/threonine protein phosphatase PrpC
VAELPRPADVVVPVLGRPSPAAAGPVPLRSRGGSAVADYRAAGGDAGSLRLRAATVAGVRHRLAGRPGEDDYAWATGDGWVVVAVADGVGTTARAGQASATAVTSAVAAAAAHLDGAGMDLEAAAATGLEAAADDLVGLSGEGATTLVVAAVGADGRWEAGRVGDSTALVLAASGLWVDVFPPGAEDGVVTTATDALPAPDWRADRGAGSLGTGEALILLTDGVADPLRDGPDTVAPGLAAALADPPSPLTLAAIADFSRQGCHDDRTIAAVWWVAAEPQR